MSNIFIPIDSSDLRKAIPEGEDIIYSTLCKGEGEAMFENKKWSWNSHLLMTQKGMYFTIPLNARFSKKQIAKLNPKLEVFAPWYNIGNVVTADYMAVENPGKVAKMAMKYAAKQQKDAMIAVGGIENGKEIDFYTKLYVIRDPNFETEEKYYERIAQLKEFIDNYKVPIKLDIAKYLYTKFDENPKYKFKEFKNDNKYSDLDRLFFEIIKTDWKKGNGPGASLS